MLQKQIAEYKTTPLSINIGDLKATVLKRTITFTTTDTRSNKEIKEESSLTEFSISIPFELAKSFDSVLKKIEDFFKKADTSSNLPDTTEIKDELTKISKIKIETRLKQIYGIEFYWEKTDNKDAYLKEILFVMKIKPEIKIEPPPGKVWIFNVAVKTKIGIEVVFKEKYEDLKANVFNISDKTGAMFNAMINTINKYYTFEKASLIELTFKFNKK